MSAVSKMTAASATAADPMVPQTGIVDSNTADVQKPSDVVEPTRTDSIPQQGSVQPGDGSKDHFSGSGQPPNIVEAPQVPFKEQVIGYAKKTRGTVLNKHDTKVAGEKILHGEATHDQL